MKVVDTVSNKLRDSADIQFVDELFRLKKTKGLWAVVDKIIEHWLKTNPKEYNSFIVDMHEKRDTRLNRHGSDKDKNLRSLLDVPSDVLLRLRVVYKADELPMDKEFFDRMYKKYEFMRVAEKI